MQYYYDRILLLDNICAILLLLEQFFEVDSIERAMCGKRGHLNIIANLQMMCKDNDISYKKVSIVV